LDPVSRLEVWSAIKELKGNMVLTTHYMDEAAELSEDIVMIDSGRVLQHGTVQQMLSKFKGKVRAETMHPDKSARHRIGNTYFSYINIGDSEKYIKKGYSIKRVTLDDLFISRGVEIEP
jgi:ABC-2 type transport system ATP-binding protein